LSGIDAVKKIVQIEVQARRVVEEAKTKAQEIISRAREDADKIRQEAIAQAQRQKELILKAAREKAEAEARQSDLETERMLESYGKLSDERKASAVDKAVELILGA
jgi:ATP synthase H subunit